VIAGANGGGRSVAAVTDPTGGDGALGIGVRFLGHATVVLDLPGFRVVTDPFLRPGLGPLRRHGALPRPDEIGPVAYALISHAHPDHFDRASLEALPGEPLVIAPRGLGRAIRSTGLRAREVSVGEAVPLAAGWTVTAVPARHWRWIGAPRAATIGYLIEGPGRVGIWFAGDTGPFHGMRALVGRVDVALLPVGSWGPHLTPGHLSPRSAAGVARLVGARVAVPIHWGTLYPLGLHRGHASPLTEPGPRFAAWARELAPRTDVRVLAPGESTTIDR
jgi:L-ascorbate metabolism protein UlaG (beta-lactamase superfamily)